MKKFFSTVTFLIFLFGNLFAQPDLSFWFKGTPKPLQKSTNGNRNEVIDSSIFEANDIPPEPCIRIRPNQMDGKDAWITSNQPFSNFGNYPNFAAIAWTSNGDGFISRGLLEFNLSAIPSNANLTSAKLSLYCNSTSDHPQIHSSLSGSNSCYLQRITSNWNENSVNWSNQPSTTNLNQVVLLMSSDKYQDYLNIDVLALVKDFRAYPSSSFGFMIKLITEIQYRSLIFANSDHTDSTKWPVLEICYNLLSGVDSELGQTFEGINLYPNPLQDAPLTIDIGTKLENTRITIQDISGRVLYRKDFEMIHSKVIIPNEIFCHQQAGTYIVQLDNELGVYRKKMVLN